MEGFGKVVCSAGIATLFPCLVGLDGKSEQRTMLCYYAQYALYRRTWQVHSSENRLR